MNISNNNGYQMNHKSWTEMKLINISIINL